MVDTILGVIFLVFVAFLALGLVFRLMEVIIQLAAAAIMALIIAGCVILVIDGYWVWAIAIGAAGLTASSYLSSNAFKCKLSEFLVNRKLAKLCKNNSNQFLSDVTLPYKNKTSQIDHVFVTTAGVFVIETKNYGGRIKGRISDYKWNQRIGNQSNMFYNPVKQNQTHINALSSLTINEGIPFINVVVFSKSNFLIEDVTDSPWQIITALKDLDKKLNSFEGKMLTGDEINSIVLEIESARLPPGRETNKIHLQNLKQR